MNKYVLKIDDASTIVYRAYTFDYNHPELIEVTQEEFEISGLYCKFNKETREFFESRDCEVEQTITSVRRIEQLEEIAGVLAEQVAKQTLGI